MQHLRELLWVEQVYNLLLLGPPGVGKTFLAIGLGIEAIDRGYKVSFIQMDVLLHLFKLEDEGNDVCHEEFASSYFACIKLKR